MRITSFDAVPFTAGQHLVVLTGAGISAESGVPTFRDSDGLWEGHPVDLVATPAGFRAHPREVWAFYHMLRAKAAAVKPNAAHAALARLEHTLPPGSFTLITQNVDPLHVRAGSANVLHMHGELGRVICTRCPYEQETWERLEDLPHCPSCAGLLRPKITWFGEIPFCMDEISAAMDRADLFAVSGTSGVVYPAAALVQEARARAVPALCINKEPPANAALFDFVWLGPAGTGVPLFANHVLSRITT